MLIFLRRLGSSVQRIPKSLTQ